MNGIVFLSVAVALESSLVFQGGMDFGWTQLPDDRVEYIIQLDEQALQALREGQPLTSSIPPEAQGASRIRLQFGSAPLNKPLLTRKPQTFTPPPATFPTAGSQVIADTAPQLNQEDAADSDLRFGGLSGQVTVKDGNLNTVSNSSVSGTRRTAYVTQETGTNNALNWSNSNRVIGNFDTQDRRLADTRNNAAAGANSNGPLPGNINNGAVMPGNSSSREVMPGNTGFNGGNQPGNNTNLDPRTNFGANANMGNAMDTAFRGNATNADNRLNPNFNSQPGAQTNFNSGMSRVPNTGNDNGGWSSVTNSNRNGFQNQSQGNVNPNMINPNLMTGMTNNVPANGFPNAQNYLPQNNANVIPPGSVGVPVNTTVPSSEVAMLNKTIEEMKNEQRQRDHEQEIAKLKADQKAELEKLTNQFKEFQNKKEEKTATAPAVAQNTNDESKKGSTSGIASVFLVISLGLNVFLVVQYLSVQNQFRDLSNDLRDTFMTNNYE